MLSYHRREWAHHGYNQGEIYERTSSNLPPIRAIHGGHGSYSLMTRLLCSVSVPALLIYMGEGGVFFDTGIYLKSTLISDNHLVCMYVRYVNRHAILFSYSLDGRSSSADRMRGITRGRPTGLKHRRGSYRNICSAPIPHIVCHIAFDVSDVSATSRNRGHHLALETDV